MTARSLTVLVTGASSGIGRACALWLASRGHHVLAGVRRTADGEALEQEAGSGVTSLQLDVADQASVAAAAARVRELLGEDAGLDGLVNNAGIGVTGPMEFIEVERLRLQLDVNVTGQVRVTQAFLPMLRRARGRLVFMSSESGRMTLPMMGPYSASKHALEAVANAFRLELRSAGIGVTLIEPGSIQSRIWDKAIDENTALLEALPPQAHQRYPEAVVALVEVPRLSARMAIPAERVARKVEHALTTRRPRARYVVGVDAHLLIAFFRFTPTSVADALVTRAMGSLAKRLGRGGT